MIELSELNFKFNLSEANYELDALQNEMLQFYLRNDQKFRIAYNTNYTGHFIQFMKDKAKLHEPIHLSCIGKTRSGKSEGMLSLCIIHSLLNGRMFTIQYVCGNSYEFIEKLKEMETTDLLNSIFQIDEQKNATYGAGSIARKTKILDVQNIIAVNNISTISLTPDKWANEQADYGLRAFGRCFKTQTNRYMLYNLQEGGKGGSLPLGMVYLPIFRKLLPEPYSSQLAQEYKDKKQSWVNKEMRGEGDVVAMIHKRTAQTLMRDIQFVDLKKKNQRKTYIQQKLGSEWTSSECDAVLQLTDMMRNGVNFD